MRLPRTPDGINTEATRRSQWNGKSLRKNVFWILEELRASKRRKKVLDNQKDLF